MLNDLLVIEIGQVLAGPYAGAIMADLGARVIKIEKPEGGDDSRRMGQPFLDDDALTFHEYNRGKESVVLDLKTPEGIARLHELAERADILIHNLRPDVPYALGIDPERFCERHPRIIYCEVSGFGNRGPLHIEPAFEPLLQAFSGIVSVNGEPDSRPSRLPISPVDLGTGMWTVIGILTALRERDRTGRGTVVRTSLLATAIGWMAPRINALVNEGKEQPREAMSGHAGLVPYQAFPTRDGDIFICCGNDRLFLKLCRVLDCEHLAHDAAFATNRDRLTNREQLVPLLAERLLGETRSHWTEQLRAAGVPCSPVNNLRELMAHEQFASVDMMSAPLNDDGARLVSLPLIFNDARVQPKALGPRLGSGDASGS
jgi:formyl-CoA transferase